MSLSFLYKEKSDFQQNSAFIKDLSIDRIVGLIVSDIPTQEYVLDILSKLERNRSNIIWRQELLADFINNPLLHEKLTGFLENFDRIMNDWEKLRRDTYTLNSFSAHSTSTMLDNNSPLLVIKINSEILLRIFKFYISLTNLLSSNEIHSEMLINLRSFCRSITENPAFRELGDVVSEMAALSISDTSYEIICEFDDRLRIIDAHLYKMGHYDGTEPNMRGIFNLFKSEKARASNTVPIEMNSDAIVGEMNTLLHSSASKIGDTIEAIGKAFSKPFEGRSNELVFYKFALLYYIQLKEINGGMCNPAIKDAEEDCFKCEKLYDLYIALGNARKHRKQVKHTVPNDVMLGNKEAGLLVRGKNNTGKTVFLRSIGVAQVFAQAGLPVAADSAVISIRSGIFTQFSSKEEELSVEGIAGRFEAEVKIISQIIDSISPGALILLNETFQTTAFEEARTALFDILCIFTRISAKWIFVTHIHGLFNMLSDFKEETGGRRILPLTTFDEDDEINRYRLKEITTS